MQGADGQGETTTEDGDGRWKTALQIDEALGHRTTVEEDVQPGSSQLKRAVGEGRRRHDAAVAESGNYDRGLKKKFI